MWNPERGLADRSCFFFALFSGCRLRSDRMLFLSHLKWRVTMSNTIKGATITITIKVIMINTISHHPSHPDQSHPQSSMAAPAEEAAQLLRVKRCIFYIIFKVSKKFLTWSLMVPRQEGGDILNGCDPNTAIGGFLLFPLFRAICAERGFEDAGAYGK